MIPPTISQATLLTIRNTISLYCLALDTHDFKLLTRVFTEDMTADYSAVSPQNQEVKGLDTLVGKLNVILDGKVTQHALTTQILDFEPVGEGWECKAMTYFTANTFAESKRSGDTLNHVSVFGRYEDRLVEIGGGEWRITERVVRTFHPRIQNASVLPRV